MLKFIQRLFRPGSDVSLPGAPVALPFEVREVSGAQALPARAELLQQAGITPVIMGERDDIRLVEELLPQCQSTPQALIDEALKLDVDAWLSETAASDPEYYSAPTPEPRPAARPQTQLSLHLGALTRRPKKRVLIGLVPTPAAWQAPAFTCYGGWNECPPPHVHVAIHKRWHERYGATIACLSGDIIECTVARPPTCWDDAYLLAREQFIYCADIVHQGTGSIEALAASLLAAPVWYFWWD